MKNRLREELEAMLELHTGDSFTADNVHTLVNGILAIDEVGGFEYVEYDDDAFQYPQEIGKTADSITGLGPATEEMIHTIFIMPNKEEDPDATLMIVVEEKDLDSDTYQYVYVGNINDLPSDVLTESSIVNDLISGGTDKPLSAEQGRTLNSHVNYTTCGSNAEDQVKLISDDGFELSTHLRLLVRMTNTNTNSIPKFNINNTGVKDVWYNGSVASDINTWSAGEVLDVYYDGTNYVASTHGGAQFSTGEKVGSVGIDDEPLAGSENLVKSGGVQNEIYKVNDNLFGDLRFTENGYINTSGVFKPSSSYVSTKKIEVSSGDSVSIYVYGSAGVLGLAAYDDSDSLVSNESIAGNNELIEQTYIVPNGVASIRLCHYITSSVPIIPSVELHISPLTSRMCGIEKWVAVSNPRLENTLCKSYNGELSDNLISSTVEGKYVKPTSNTVFSSADLEYVSAQVIAGRTYRFHGYTDNIGLLCRVRNSQGNYVVDSSSSPYYTHIVCLDEDTLLYEITIPEGGAILDINHLLADENQVFIKLILNSTDKFPITWLKTNASNIDSNKTILSSQLVQHTYLTDGYRKESDTTKEIVLKTSTSLKTIVLNSVLEGEIYLVTEESVVAESLYSSFFVFAKTTTEAAIYASEISDYVELYDAVNFIYKITIPRGCTIFYSTCHQTPTTTIQINKIEEQKALDWLKLESANFPYSILDYISNIVKNYIIEEKKHIRLYDNIKRPIVFSGKTVAAFGDSITYGVYSPNLDYAATASYMYHFCQYAGATLDNKAVSGSCITDADDVNTSIRDKVTSYSGTADIIIIAGGCNDYRTGKPLGTYDSQDNNTFYGALRSICSYLQTNYPSADVIFITPIDGTRELDNHISPLDTYRTAIFEIATEYGFSVIDGSSIGFPQVKGGWANTMIDDSDGVHPTLLGHLMYAKALCGKLL